MKKVFADAHYFLAVFNSRDQAHAKALEFAAKSNLTLVSTVLALSEFASGVAHSNRREAAADMIERFLVDPKSIVVSLTDDLFRRGAQFYGKRNDKQWSLVDCISFLVMSEQGINEALTGDHHFEQAGFKALLR
jgi:predicted nucleic acid-binding protein